MRDLVFEALESNKMNRLAEHVTLKYHIKIKDN